MSESDFRNCKYINDYSKFYTLKEFCDNRIIIKHYYDQLNDNGKQFYKWYVYANIWLNEKIKNAIWDYLNDSDDGRVLMQYRRTFVHK